MKKLSIVLMFVLFVPFFAHASDEALRASMVSKLLAQFVIQVNLIDELQLDIANAVDPSQFDSFKTSLLQQLAFTTQQVVALLNPNSTVSIVGSPVIVIEPIVTTPNPVVEPTPEPITTIEPTTVPVIEQTPIIVNVVVDYNTNWFFELKKEDNTGFVTAENIVVELVGTLKGSDLSFLEYRDLTGTKQAVIEGDKILIENARGLVRLIPRLKDSGYGKTLAITIRSLDIIELGENEVLE